MFLKKVKLLAAAAAVLMVAASCSSSSKSSGGTSTTGGSSASTSGGSGGGSSGGGNRTYTVGVLTDLTGLAATNALTFPSGVKAGVSLAAKDGYTIKYVVADTASSPTGALAAAQKLVDQDHVFAVLA